MTVRQHVHVSGRVQGVFYRDTCRRLAAERGVAGWVRNLHNGDVEAVFEGHPDDVAAMARWAAEGPPAAQVTRCTGVAEEPEGLSVFRVLADARPGDDPGAG
ncbi:acylphosphatase [Streptomyces cellostaticus]|uniref:acylphosphatase n=1 Tax=Streptomyces cellostaticus TaxID=67285 RepID=A0A101NPK4_9ACTN|nr:acylphosphatase [Streptomyces cellostaticus]KUM97093.1 acylphosphatase [Streptomyces cellostaticus]GHI03841.1 acylphosphatase [Streptomyces cellostaticus]